MRLIDLFERQYRPHRLRSGSDKTLTNWRGALRRFDRFLGCEATITDLDDLTVNRFAESRRDTVGPATVNSSTRPPKNSSALAVASFTCASSRRSRQRDGFHATAPDV